MIHLRSGRCLVCRCTDRAGCAAGCHWVDDWHTLCSRCARNMAVLILALRYPQEGKVHAA
jgi:hypothetical protein